MTATLEVGEAREETRRGPGSSTDAKSARSLLICVQMLKPCHSFTKPNLQLSRLCFSGLPEGQAVQVERLQI